MSQPQSPEVPSATSGSGTSSSGLVPTTVDRVRLKQPEKAQDGGWGWVVVLGSCICHFFLIGINRSMGIVYLLLQEHFDATGKQTALAASIFVSFRALGGEFEVIDLFIDRLIEFMNEQKTKERMNYFMSK